MRATELTIAYIGGGSRGWAWGFMKDLAMDARLCGVVRLYDIDLEAAQKNRRIGQMISAHPGALSRWRYEVAETLAEALAGADFVVISILPGTFAHMQSDVHAPEKVGVYQSVGDTTGPGGLLRTLRAVPMFAGFARAIREHAPNAWVINYTNPMSACLLAMYTEFPGIRAFGCCHEVFGTQKLLAAMLWDMEGIPGVTRRDISTGVSGVNHFTWLTRVSYQCTDLVPLYEKFAEKYALSGYSSGADDNWMNSFFASSHRVKFDLFLRYGRIAAAGDRHLAEFMPPWYLKNADTAHQWGFTLTPVSWRMQDLAKRIRKREGLLDGSIELDMTSSGEEGHLLLAALAGLGDILSNVNLLNRGQAPDLPVGCVVETNAHFSGGDIRPVLEEPLPGAVTAMVSRHAFNHMGAVRAALNCDRQEALRVLLNDPQMGGVNPADAEQLLSEMIANTLDVLPEGWRKG